MNSLRRFPRSDVLIVLAAQSQPTATRTEGKSTDQDSSEVWGEEIHPEKKRDDDDDTDALLARDRSL